MAEPKTICCLFSVDSNYDQPDHNLVAWWSERPSLEVLASAIAGPLASMGDEHIAQVVSIWKGAAVQFGGPGCTIYRLGYATEGARIDGEGI